MQLVRLVASAMIPPLGVFLRCGLGKSFWLNLILTLFGYLPGVVHAFWILLKE
jgi:uncharacterized membrane protein YqaE (UPF0057 family)